MFGAASSFAAEPTNYDEAKIPAYKLPDPLVDAAGNPIKNERTWLRKRRPELLKLFQEHVYGISPIRPENEKFAVTQTDANALGGIATRKNVTIRFAPESEKPRIDFVMYVPNKPEKPVPIFVGIHLFKKDADHPTPGASLREQLGDAAEQARKDGLDLDKLPGERLIETILERGYAIATLDAADLAPDDADKARAGVLNFYAKEGQTVPAPNDWNAIGAWAWGLSRAMDYFETDKDIDEKCVIAIGHSRMGKTALWAAAQDQRFAIAISNESGCGGAALSKRVFGETVGMINDRFPHWFCGNFKKYNQNEAALPVDQHELIALIAPRPVYIASATEDRWADPRGEFLSAVAAEPVFHLLGKKGLEVKETPKLNSPVGETIGYHIRSGKHALSDYDWMRYLDFADRQFAMQAP